MNTYRLANESEWELAAGHMPKDADFNCGVRDGRTLVEEYADVTRGAHGAVDFWGNVWEWTSTVRSEWDDSVILGVKGGSWESARTDCRTEYREEGRDAAAGYEDVGFRVIQVKNGEEPEQAVALTTLNAPTITAAFTTDHSITLSWEPVEGAAEYQLFEYSEGTGLLTMLNRTADATVTMENLAPGSTHSYIVQPISFVEIDDNVSPEYRVTAICLQTYDSVYEMEGPILLASTGGVETAAASGPALDDSIVVLIAGILAAAAAVMIVTLLAVKKRR